MVVMKGGRDIAPSFLPHLRLSFHGERERGERERGRTNEIIVLRLMPDDDPSFYAADFNTGEGTNYLVILLAENFAPPAVLRRVPGPRCTRRRGVAQTNALRSRRVTFSKSHQRVVKPLSKDGEDSCAEIYETVEESFANGRTCFTEDS